jgi:hypothetical protein
MLGVTRFRGSGRVMAQVFTGEERSPSFVAQTR